MIDSHCHLADPVFAGDLEAVVARAREAGLERALVILAAGDDDESRQARRVEELWPAVRFAVGVHPQSAEQFEGGPERAADIVRLQVARTPSALAIGEIGLDYHYHLASKEVQQAVFRAQLRLAAELDRPVIIHTREAEEDTIRLLREQPGTRGVLHCFTGSPYLAEQGLALGFYVSLAGILTFPKASDLRETVKTVPLDRLLTETDSPFLAPVPHRGKRNEPAHVAQVVSALALLWGVSAQDMAAQTAANFHTLFRP